MRRARAAEEKMLDRVVEPGADDLRKTWSFENQRKAGPEGKARKSATFGILRCLMKKS
jgi:hypothetical protein